MGAPADVAVFSLEKGTYGLVDMYGARHGTHRKFVCELTVREGKVLYDLNGLTRERWDKLPKDYGPQGDPDVGRRYPFPAPSPAPPPTKEN